MKNQTVPLITDKVTSYEAACELLGLVPLSIDNYNFLPEERRANALAHEKLLTITKALNERWVPDWNNNSQYKYYPYFDMQNGFSFYVVFDCRGSHVGSRLCFKTEQLAEYAGRQFENIYREYFIITE